MLRTAVRDGFDLLPYRSPMVFKVVDGVQEVSIVVPMSQQILHNLARRYCYCMAQR